MAESALSAEVAAVTLLPAPTELVPRKTDAGNAEVTWVLPDDNPAGTVSVERSDDGGATWSDLATGLDADTESVTDTSISDGVPYVYRVTRTTPHATAVSEPAELVGEAFDVSIVGTNSPVNAGESLEVTVQVDNQGGRGTADVALSLEDQ